MDLADIRKAGSYPLPGVSEEQPFPTGAGGCEGFRIPGLIRLADGGLFATVDARWSRPDDDCGGIDTMFALSDDGGATWRRGFAAYFPDTLGSPARLADATTCLDPMPVQTPDGAIHIFVNLGPTGVTPALRFPLAGTGFLTVGGARRLALTDDFARADDPPETFPYYVGGARGGFSPVLTRGGGETDYALDERFNLYRRGSGGYEPLWQPQIDTGAPVVQNVFYRDSLLHVYNTTYTLQLTSADRGETWRWALVSGEMKLQTERAAVASPGCGLVTAAGRAVLPFYSWSEEVSASFLVFSDDCCKTFFRSPCLPATDEIPWSGENKPVELPDGTLRVFFRNKIRRICYADYDPAAEKWSRPEALPVLVHADCNFGALARGDTVYIAWARGVGPEARTRTHGRVYVFRLGESNGMTLTDVLPAAEDAFSYAVLARLGADTLALLYDTCGDGLVHFKTITIPTE